MRLSNSLKVLNLCLQSMTNKLEQLFVSCIFHKSEYNYISLNIVADLAEDSQRAPPGLDFSLILNRTTWNVA